MDSLALTQHLSYILCNSFYLLKSYTVSIVLKSYHQALHLLHPLRHGLAFLGPHEHVHIADVRHGIEKLLDEHFAHETGASSD